MLSPRGFPFFVRFAALVAVATEPVAATGLFRNGAGGRSMALGGTGVAGAETPLEAMAFNPAALAHFDETTISLGYFGGYADATFSNALNGSVNLSRRSGHGGELAFSVPVAGGRGALGLSLIPEATLVGDWDYIDAPGGLDGSVSYGRERHRSRFIAVRTAFGGGWRVNERLSIGASVGLVYERIDLEVPYIFQSTPGLAGFKTLLDLESDGLAWNGEVGLLYQINDDLQFGLRYRSSTSLDSEGRAAGNADAQLAAAGLGGIPPDFRYDGRVSVSLPDIYSASLAWQARPDLQVVVGVDWIPWSEHFNALDVRLTNGNNADLNGVVGADRISDRVPLGWEDRLTWRAAVAYQLNPCWQLRAGWAYSESPIPDGFVTPLNAAIAEHTVTAGVGYRRDNWSIDFGYQLDLHHRQSVDRSRYRAEEYSDSSVALRTHWWGLSTTVRY